MIGVEDGLFNEDARFLTELIQSEWSLDMDNIPESISYEQESFMTNARVGSIYVYEVSVPFGISTTDYATLRRTGHVSIRVSNRFRENHIKWCNEISRILLANRRAGPEILNGYEYLEVTNYRPSNDLSGWYTTTIEVKLTQPHVPVESPGFGSRVNELMRKCREQGSEEEHPCECRGYDI